MGTYIGGVANVQNSFSTLPAKTQGKSTSFTRNTHRHGVPDSLIAPHRCPLHTRSPHHPTSIRKTCMGVSQHPRSISSSISMSLSPWLLAPFCHSICAGLSRVHGGRHTRATLGLLHDVEEVCRATSTTICPCELSKVLGNPCSRRPSTRS